MSRQTLDTVLPFQDEAVVVVYSGRELRAVLENSVSQYPLLDGRFLQVSGLRFAFDPHLPAGERVLDVDVLHVDGGCESDNGDGGRHNGDGGSDEGEDQKEEDAHKAKSEASADVNTTEKTKKKKVWRPLRAGRMYKVATKTYVFDGKDGFPEGDKERMLSCAKVVPEMVREYLKGLPVDSELGVPVLAPEVEGRIECLHPDEELGRFYEAH